MSEKTKRAWKPLDVGGLRLYKVFSTQRSNNVRREYVVAARSPSDATHLLDAIYEPGAGFNNWGVVLNVYQPADWWENGVPCCEEASK